MLPDFFKTRRHRFAKIIVLILFGWLIFSRFMAHGNAPYSKIESPISEFFNSQLEDHSEFLRRKPQKCKIPILDPYHPEVKPFIKKVSAPECDYPKLTEVTDDGILQVKVCLKI